MKVVAFYLLLLLCMTGFAACWVAAWSRVASRAFFLCIAGCLAVALVGAILPAALGYPALRGHLAAGMVVAYGLLLKSTGFVWLKKRLARRGRARGPFWAQIDDDYYRPRWVTRSTPTELEAADVPAGRGTEPEASTEPAGRGDELVGLVQAGGVPEGDRLPPHPEHERRPGRT